MLIQGLAGVDFPERRDQTREPIPPARRIGLRELADGLLIRFLFIALISFLLGYIAGQGGFDPPKGKEATHVSAK